MLTIKALLHDLEKLGSDSEMMDDRYMMDMTYTYMYMHIYSYIKSIC